MIANKCPSGRPEDPNRSRKSVVLAHCHISRHEVKIRKPKSLGLKIELLIKLHDFTNWLLWRAMISAQLRNVLTDGDKQNVKWN